MLVTFTTHWQHWRKGETYDLPDGQANYLIGRKFAQLAQAEASADTAKPEPRKKK